MGPKVATGINGDLFKQSLAEMINLKHPLVKLADAIDWGKISEHFAAHFVSTRGRPALPPRLAAGLL